MMGRHNIKLAQNYFELKQYEKSAEIFARTRKPFEEVCLMFMDVRSKKALRIYLSIRLNEFDSKETSKITMTLSWLFELIVSSISVIQIREISGRLPVASGDNNNGIVFDDEKIANELDDLYQELDSLFENKIVVDCIRLHTKLFYGIIRNYSNWELFIRVAKLVGDHEHVVQCYLDLGDHAKALETIKTANRVELFYKYGHILMKRMPKELVDALIEQKARNIQPVKMIPILIQENLYFNKCQETKRFLEYCINDLNDDSKVIHNYLFELYARYGDENQLMSYLDRETSSSSMFGGGLFEGFSSTATSLTTQPQQQYCPLDLQLCLRLCTELKLVKTCVMLYSYMGLQDEAVQLALTFDMELAKSIAKKVDSEDHQKRLWLCIAEIVLSRNADIQVASNLLRESHGLLKIDYILSFFPNYTIIDFFKDAINQSLLEYRNQIMSLRDGTYDNIADEIQGEIKAFRSRYSIIKVGQRCEICAQGIMSRTFYVFPCGHLFHSDCIIKEIIAMDPQYKGLEERLDPLTVTELDEILSSECIYCGSLLASYVNKPAPFHC